MYRPGSEKQRVRWFCQENLSSRRVETEFSNRNWFRIDMCNRLAKCFVSASNASTFADAGIQLGPWCEISVQPWDAKRLKQRLNGASPLQLLQSKEGIQVYSFGKRTWHWTSPYLSENHDNRVYEIRNWTWTWFFTSRPGLMEQMQLNEEQTRFEIWTWQVTEVTVQLCSFCMFLWGPPPCDGAPVWGLSTHRNDWFHQFWNETLPRPGGTVG